MDVMGAEIGQLPKLVCSEDVPEKLRPCVCFWGHRSTCTLEYNLRACSIMSAQRMQLPESPRGTFSPVRGSSFPRIALFPSLGLTAQLKALP